MISSFTQKNIHICVLGAGIVGLTTAWQLQQQGYRVTVVDKGQPGGGASGANGAQLSFSYVQPLADPSLWRQLPKLLLNKDSPLKIRLQADIDQWRWGLSFLAACRADVSRRTMTCLLRLASESREVLEQLVTQVGMDCGYSSTGKLVLYADNSSFDAALQQMQWQRELGGYQAALTRNQTLLVEPALSHYAPHFIGAIHTPSECAIDCYRLTQQLAKNLEDQGVRFITGSAVKHLERQGARLVAAHLTSSVVRADAFVLAMGAGSPSVGRTVGVYLPIYPIKGYSITLDASPRPGDAPRVNVTDAKRRVVFARLGDQLRVAGMAELGQHDLNIPADRVTSLLSSARAVFPHAATVVSDVRPWAGLRPATPTGLPIVGRLPKGPENLWINTGHGPLGLTLACGSAKRLAVMIQSARSQ